MNKNVLKILLTGAVVCSMVLLEAAAMPTHKHLRPVGTSVVSQGTPTGLTVEFIRHPEHTAVIDPHPEFGWLLPPDMPYQTGYQILVASSRSSLDDGMGDVWDSGFVESASSINVAFQGNALQERRAYYWKVRCYGSDGQASPWSDTQLFRTGVYTDHITTSNIAQIENIKPSSHHKMAGGGFFLDFGKAAFATLKLHYKPKKKETLTIRVGEKLLDGQIDRKPGGTIRYQELQMVVTPSQDSYTISLVPDKRNTNHMAVAMPDSFPVILPFRYAEIEGVGTTFDPSRQEQIAYFNYFDYTTSAFSSSDTVLNRVWDLCKYTMKATTFAGYYVDGDRERIPYEADSYLNQLTHYAMDNEYAIARKTIEYFFVSKPTWPTEWQLHVAMMMYQDYLFTGNTEIIEKYYERLKAKTLMALEVEDGFISIQSPNHDGAFMASLGFPDSTQRLKDIVDWPPPSKNFGGFNKPQQGEQDGFVFKRINTVVNGFYYHNMMIMAQFASILNKPDEALDFSLRATKVKKSINEKLFNKEKGYYMDGIGTGHASIHSNMILLAFDLVPQDRVQSVVDFVKSRGMACSVYASQYLMEALYKAGEADYALELMAATHDRSWYNMIKIGSTMTLEAWDMKYKVNADWNHAWGATPGNIIPRGMWGINPKTPGFGEVVVKPQMSRLANSSLTFPTIRGPIQADYKRHNSQLSEYHIHLPANMVGEFMMDRAHASELVHNDTPINPLFGSIRLVPGDNHIIIKAITVK
ncbi:alpha-L-rhamnosidase-like protein [Dyadobacter jejuensis]|uniref:alpha-L-rhamnosidase n=1 Tax=Dyadobacter jejuensis TaxID=1082580 RepID=A0A316AKU7_9BACT|nr:alpha-L-rhamnosidase C-terminal domain-containing protein [Dyadobacter jejuensis]PWJ57869.1 alpha-L-rhamnosidase-like protein [Dyadobacter jejuensis]